MLYLTKTYLKKYEHCNFRGLDQEFGLQHIRGKPTNVTEYNQNLLDKLGCRRNY